MTFREVIWPDVLAQPNLDRSCVGQSGCHERANGRSALRLVADEPLTLTDHTQNYQVVTRFLNCGTPSASPLITKPIAGGEQHGGGDIFQPGDMEETLILDWVAP